MFVQNKNIHNYGTRHIELYRTSLATTILISNSLRYAGVIFWNKKCCFKLLQLYSSRLKSRIKQFVIMNYSMLKDLSCIIY